MNSEEKALENIVCNFRENTEKLTKAVEMRLGAVAGAVSAVSGASRVDSGAIELAGIYKSSIEDVLKLKSKKDTPLQIKQHISAYSEALSVVDTVTLAKMILEGADKENDNIGVELLDPEAGIQPFSEDVRIVYRKAHGADIAFEKFASLLPDAAALYRDNFPNVCDSVALGDADMCILPYENTEDGKLSGFYRLIENYDLKIAASCLVRSDNREDKTRYLLLSRNLVGLSMLSGVTDFELALTDRNNGSLTRTLSAAYIIGVDIISIDTVRREGDACVYDIRISGDSDKIDTFILYLKLERTEFSPLGLYAVID